MRKEVGIPHGDHIGPCSTAGLAAGELAVTVREGTPYSLPIHAVGTEAELAAAGHDLTELREIMAGCRLPAGPPHLCECNRREHARVRAIRRAQVREYVAGRAPRPERIWDGGYACMLAAERARGVALSPESHAMADLMLAGGADLHPAKRPV